MKIDIGTLSRIEGHGGILVELEGKTVKSVQFNIAEGPRLIETLTIGKTPEEDLNIVSRICAICTLSHRYAALRALEKALGVQVSPKVHSMRTLMHMGEMIESHALHIFFLSLPDLLRRSSAIDLLDTYRNEVEIALRLKKFGNKVMSVTSARMIHGENPVIGGFGRYPSIKELQALKEEAEELVPFAVKALELLSGFSYPSFFEQKTLFMALNPQKSRYGFVGDTVLLSSGEERSIGEYKELTNERVVPHSCAKRSGYKGKPFSVGALARANILGERLTGEAGRCFGMYYNPRWMKNPLFNINAQALEVVFSLEEILRLIDRIIPLEDPPIVRAVNTKGEGTGAVEAPRGTLYHSYRIDNGFITDADIITPTAQFLDDVERYFRLAVERFPSDSDEEIGFTLETIARAYDPCVSCSTHLVTLKRGKCGTWKDHLRSLFGGSHPPLFVGMGNTDRADDGIGMVIAQRLKELDRVDVFLEEDGVDFLICGGEKEKRPVIFIDAADFDAVPGEIALVPLESATKERIATHGTQIPFLRELLEEKTENFYILAVQPAETGFSPNLSPQVSRTVDEIVRIIDERAEGGNDA